MDPEERIGTQFAGRYQILRMLGEGGMGAVFEARHQYTGVHVALKLIHRIIAKSPTARERFMREAQAPSSIGHPAIVKVLDAGVGDDGTPYLALEMLDGEDLGKAMAHGRVTASELVSHCGGVLEALGAAHEAGLVHRDIKPENVFLVNDPQGGPRQVKLLDFGITRQLGTTDSKLTGTGTILGTPYYMSPEQARGEHVDARADLWSVGAMLYHGLAGHPPFDAANYNLLIVAILTTDAMSLGSARGDLPAALCHAVDGALQKDPAARWQNAAAMREALLAVGEVSASIPASLGTGGTLASDQDRTGPDVAPLVPPTQATPMAAVANPSMRSQTGPMTPPAGATTPGAITGSPATTPGVTPGSTAPLGPMPTAMPVAAAAPRGKSRVPMFIGLAILGVILMFGVGVAALVVIGSGADVEDIGEGRPGPDFSPDEAESFAPAGSPEDLEGAPDELAEAEAMPDEEEESPAATQRAHGRATSMMSRTIVSGRPGQPTVTVGEDGRVTIDGLATEQIERLAEREANLAMRQARRAAARRQQRTVDAQKQKSAVRHCQIRCSIARHQCVSELRASMDLTGLGHLRCHQEATACERGCQD